MSFTLPKITRESLNKATNEQIDLFKADKGWLVCAQCKTQGTTQTIKRCSRCGESKKVYYCGRQCQSRDWAQHKITCGQSFGGVIASTEISGSSDLIKHRSKSWPRWIVGLRFIAVWAFWQVRQWSPFDNTKLLLKMSFVPMGNQQGHLRPSSFQILPISYDQSHQSGLLVESTDGVIQYEFDGVTLEKWRFDLSEINLAFNLSGADSVRQKYKQWPWIVGTSSVRGDVSEGLGMTKLHVFLDATGPTLTDKTHPISRSKFSAPPDLAGGKKWVMPLEDFQEWQSIAGPVISF